MAATPTNKPRTYTTPMGKYQVALFDLDGTLLDSSPGVISGVQLVIKELGLPPISPEEIASHFIGPPLHHSLGTYFNLSEEEVNKGVDIFRDYYPKEGIYKASAYEGIPSLMATLKQKGIRTGVATLKPDHLAKRILHLFGIAQYCDIIHGADLEGKLTKADIVALCLKELGAEKAQTVLVGDTEFDAQGAQAQGVAFVGVRWGFGYKEASSLPLSPYVAMVENTEELLGILTR